MRELKNSKNYQDLSLLGNLPVGNHLLSLGRDRVTGALKEIKRGLGFIKGGSWQEKPQKLRKRMIQMQGWVVIVLVIATKLS